MRSPRRARAAHIAVAAVGFLPVLGLSGCGGRTDTESAIQLEEGRPYGQVTVRSELAPKRATLGDRVLWTMTATLPKGSHPEELRLETPAPSREIEPRGAESVREAGDRVVWSRRFDVRGFDLGRLALPAASLPLVHGAGAAARRDTHRFTADSHGNDSHTAAPAQAHDPERGPIDPGWRAAHPPLQ
jgi:hypothetical protein